MCGICGFIDFRDRINMKHVVIENMVSQLSHRGPDGTGYYIKDNVTLGFSRLSIIDTEGGMQPLLNEDHSVVLICNGEIFNYRELKKELCLKGHRFCTHTDVEVILHLYEECGTGMLSRLNGQFAFVIYDQSKQILFCARDHVGIAPFFYTTSNGNFIFASEVKAILKYPEVNREMDLTALDQIMTFPGLISPKTMFKGISSLENGHYMIVTKDGNITKQEYWDLIYPKENEIIYNKNENCYIERLDELITNAVSMRLQADVPVGFYISGGLDSSIIASKIKALGGIQKRHSFSIDFSDIEISEKKYQKIMKEHSNSIHHEKIFYPEDIVNNLRSVIYHCETPIKETYNTASMVLSQMASSQGIKVVLTGEGADELFAGYVGYQFDKFRKIETDGQEIVNEKFLRNKIWGDSGFFYEKNYLSQIKEKKRIYSRKVNDVFESINCLNDSIVKKERISNIDLLHKRSYIDFKLRLPEHLLADHGDRMCYANSVEARYPFLDKELIEFAAEIPPSLKLKDFTEKYILKRVAENLVPDEIIKRPKFAFVAPGSPALIKLNDEYINEILSYDRILRNGYFDPDVVEHLKKQYAADGFKLNLPYESDLLIPVITVGIFLDVFEIPDL